MARIDKFLEFMPKDFFPKHQRKNHAVQNDRGGLHKNEGLLQ